MSRKLRLRAAGAQAGWTSSASIQDTPTSSLTGTPRSFARYDTGEDPCNYYLSTSASISGFQNIIDKHPAFPVRAEQFSRPSRLSHLEEQ